MYPLSQRIPGRRNDALAAAQCSTCDNRSMKVTIRPLNLDDWPQWRSVRLEALADSPAAFGSALADWIDATDDRWRDRIRNVPFNVIALCDDNPVGQVSATIDDPAEAVELISMWVSPTARGEGIGDALIDAVAAWAVSQQARTLTLFVKATNSPARRLYERNQFSPAGAGKDNDVVRMIRPLCKAIS